MTTMVEKVSVAIGEKLRSALSGGPPVALHEVAHAAIEAMRKPTTEMLGSPAVKRHMDSYSSNLEWWDQMISAALNEKTQ